MWIGLSLLLAVLAGVPAAAQDEAPRFSPTEEFFTEAVISNPTPFVGERVVYTFRFYAASTPVFNTLPPDFRGFWRGEEIATRYAEIVGGRQYVVSALDYVLYPLAPGTLAIDPYTLVIPESVFSERMRQELSTAALTLEVQPLPSGAPDSFYGAVGRLEAEFTLDRRTLTLGEAVTLQMRVRGAGNLEQISPPPVSDLLPQTWRVYPDPSPQGAVAAGALTSQRVFEWRVVPSETGVQTLPSIAFSAFDPQTATYETFSSEPISLEILPTADGLRELPDLNRVAAQDRNALPLKPVPALLSPQDVVPPPGFWLLWLLPPLAVLVGWGSQRLRVYLRLQQARRRASGALRSAGKRLESASALRGEAAFAALTAAITGYVEDKRNLDTVTAQETAEIVENLPIESTIREHVIACLRAAEEGRYAPPDSLPARGLIARTAEALTELDRHWPEMQPMEAS